MAWLSRISVSAKLGAFGAVFSLGMLLVAGMGFWGLDQAVSAGSTMMDRELRSVQLLGDTRSAVGNARRFEKDLFLNLADEEKRLSYLKSWGAELDELATTLEQLHPLLDGPEQVAAGEMGTAVGRYRQTVQDIVRRIEAGQINDPWAANAALEPAKGEIRAADQALARIGQAVGQRAADTRDRLMALERQVALRTLGVALLARPALQWLRR